MRCPVGPRRGRWLAAALCSCALLLTLPAGAAGAGAAGTGTGTVTVQGGAWTVLPFAERGLEPGAADTFRELLQTELAARTGAAFGVADVVCADVPCAVAAAEPLGATVAVFGSLSRLGQKVVVTATLVDVPGAAVLNSDRMTVSRIEELDTVAARLAEAFVSGRPVAETARLGTITRAEAAPDVRREGESGFWFGLGGIAPLGGGYAEAGMGVLFEFGWLFEARWFAIGPRLGVRFSAEEKGGGRYVEVPIDVTAAYIMSLGDVAPFIGIGAGVHFLWEDRPTRITVGNIIPQVSHKKVDDSAWGFGLSGRIGLLLLRTYAVRLTIWGEYGATFVDLNGHRFPQAITFGMGLVY
jgi:hypothetical protein